MNPGWQFSKAGVCQQNSAPHRDQSQKATQHNISSRDQKSTCLQICEGLPLERRERAVSPDKTNRNQVSQGGTQFRPPAQQRKNKPDDQTRRYVDNESAKRKPRAHAARNRRADPIAGERTKRAPDGNIEIVPQTVLLPPRANGKSKPSNMYSGNMPGIRLHDRVPCQES